MCISKALFCTHQGVSYSDPNLQHVSISLLSDHPASTTTYSCSTSRCKMVHLLRLTLWWYIRHHVEFTWYIVIVWAAFRRKAAEFTLKPWRTSTQVTYFSFYRYNQALRTAVILACRGAVLHWKWQGPGDLYDEHWLHVKYHIIAMTAVAFAHTSITSPASDGEVRECVLDCCDTAQRVFFLHV